MRRVRTARRVHLQERLRPRRASEASRAAARGGGVPTRREESRQRLMAAKAPACAVCELHAESTFKIEGMDCREEVVLIERRFKHLAGLEEFTADLIGQRLLVKYDAAKVSAAAIASAVA